jgi:hypothetical protein
VPSMSMRSIACMLQSAPLLCPGFALAWLGEAGPSMRRARAKLSRVSRLLGKLRGGRRALRKPRGTCSRRGRGAARAALGFRAGGHHIGHGGQARRELPGASAGARWQMGTRIVGGLLLLASVGLVSWQALIHVL